MGRALITNYKEHKFFYLMGHIHYLVNAVPEIPCPFKVYLLTPRGIGAEFICSGISSADLCIGPDVPQKELCALFVQNDSYVKYENPRPISDFHLPHPPEDYCVITDDERSYL